MTSFELGYDIIRTGGSTANRSAKGATLSIGQSITL
jgi:hypothetical protein